MRKLLKNWAWGLMAIVGWAINFIAYISPQDAVSNTSKWITSIGLNPPHWLQEKNTDHIVHYVSFFVVAIALAVFVWPIIQMAAEYWKNRLPKISSPFCERPKEYIKNATGYGPSPVNGVYELRKENYIQTNADFIPPVAFRVEAKTTAENLRIKYAETTLILNHEENTTILRIDGGPAAGMHEHGTGEIPPDKWVRVDMVFNPDSLAVYVEGKRRCIRKRDFSKQDGSLSVSQRGLSVVSVRSMLVGKPR
jgi:hypothetical protein